MRNIGLYVMVAMAALGLSACNNEKDSSAKSKEVINGGSPKTELKFNQIKKAYQSQASKLSKTAQTCVGVDNKKAAAAIQALSVPTTYSKYLQYVTFMPCNLEIRSGIQDTTQDIMKYWGTNKPIKVTNKHYNTVALRAQPNKSLFVEHPSIRGTYVPEDVMWALEAAFINGLVTRLKLEQLKEVLGPDMEEIPQLLPEPKTLQIPANPYDNSATWRTVPTGSTVQDSYRRIVAEKATGQNGYPVQLVGMADGWAFAEQIIRDPQRQVIEGHVWDLLRERLDTQRVGMIVGYTLSYAQGLSDLSYAKSLSKDKATKNYLNDLKLVSFTRAQDVFRNANKSSLNSAFLDLVILGLHEHNLSPEVFYGTTRFLVGFNEGTVQAAEVIYAETFLLAYDVGYSAGYRDGYSAGFADGYKAGERDNDFWKGAIKFVDSVGKVTSDVKGITGDVAKIASVVGPLFGAPPVPVGTGL